VQAKHQRSKKSLLLLVAQALHAASAPLEAVRRAGALLPRGAGGRNDGVAAPSAAAAQQGALQPPLERLLGEGQQGRHAAAAHHPPCTAQPHQLLRAPPDPIQRPTGRVPQPTPRRLATAAAATTAAHPAPAATALHKCAAHQCGHNESGHQRQQVQPTAELLLLRARDADVWWWRVDAEGLQMHQTVWGV